MAKTLIIIGGIIMLIGLIYHFFGDKFSWLGNLPGDVKVENEKVKIYFPITTMILLSVVLSLLSWIYRKFF